MKKLLIILSLVTQLTCLGVNYYWSYSDYEKQINEFNKLNSENNFEKAKEALNLINNEVKKNAKNITWLRMFVAEELFKVADGKVDGNPITFEKLNDLFNQKEKEIIEKAAHEATNPNIKKLIIPNSPTIPLTKEGNTEKINIEDEKDLSISHSEFKELIEDQEKLGKPYIIARVPSKDSKGEINVHYYDAHNLNIITVGHGINAAAGKGGTEYPLKLEGGVGEDNKKLYYQAYNKSYEDPIRRPMNFGIQYFEIKNLNEPEFKFLVEYKDLVKGDKEAEDWQNYFYQNYSDSPKLHMDLANKYLGLQKFDLAKTYLELVANKQKEATGHKETDEANQKLKKEAEDMLKNWEETKKKKPTGSLVIGTDYSVLSVAFSPDGTKIASSFLNLKIWNSNTGNLLKTLGADNIYTVNSVAFNPDGTKIASGSQDKTVKIWDSNTGNLLKTLGGSEGHTGIVYSVTWSPDGTKIASGSQDKTVKIWDSNTGNLLRTLVDHRDDVESVAWSLDGTKIASGSWDGKIKIWDVNTGNLLKTLLEGSGIVYSVTWSPDGTKVASGSLDKIVKIWNVNTGNFITTLRGHDGHIDTVLSVVFSPDGTKIASGSQDKTVKIWDSNTGNLLKTLKGHIGSVTSVAFSPDGNKIATGSLDKTVRIWKNI